MSDEKRFNRCEECAFWQPHPRNPEKGYRVGDCRANAPRVSLDYEQRYTAYLDGVWPVTHESEWCGQWRQRDE